MKKTFIGLFIIIIIIIIGVISYFGYNYYMDNKEELLLQDEVDEILKYINESAVNIEKIQEIITPDITTKNRIPVEKALEKYIMDCAKTVNETINLAKDEQLSNILTASNYQSDGPEFINTKKYIEETKEKLINNKETIIKLADKDEILKYFHNNTNDDYYEKMYINLAVGTGIKEKDLETFTNSIDSIISFLEVGNEALTFLSSNTMSWQIKDNQIYFTSESLLDTYNGIIAKIK